MKRSLLKSSLAGSVVAVLALSAVARAELFGPAAIRSNSAIANSPRAIETFPRLARVPVAHASEFRGTGNLAQDHSPRAIEALPELARTPVTHRAAGFRGTGNLALDHSPRAREEFPALSRVSTPSWCAPHQGASVEELD